MSEVLQHVRSSAQLHAADGSRSITPEKVEQDEHHPNAMSLRCFERRVDVSEHELIRRAWPSAIVEFNSRSTIAEQKPPNVLDSGSGKLLEDGLQVRALLWLRARRRSDLQALAPKSMP